jgi:hypothetical protein
MHQYIHFYHRCPFVSLKYICTYVPRYVLRRRGVAMCSQYAIVGSNPRYFELLEEVNATQK